MKNTNRVFTKRDITIYGVLSIVEGSVMVVKALLSTHSSYFAGNFSGPELVVGAGFIVLAYAIFAEKSFRNPLAILLGCSLLLLGIADITLLHVIPVMYVLTGYLFVTFGLRDNKAHLIYSGHEFKGQSLRNFIILFVVLAGITAGIIYFFQYL